MKGSIDDLRHTLRQAAEESGLSYREIGMRMGEPDAESAKNAVNYLLNRAVDPGIFVLMRFCNATGRSIREILNLE